jgi:hypothetical protein
MTIQFGNQSSSFLSGGDVRLESNECKMRDQLVAQVAKVSTTAALFLPDGMPSWASTLLSISAPIVVSLTARTSSCVIESIAAFVLMMKPRRPDGCRTSPGPRPVLALAPAIFADPEECRHGCAMYVVRSTYPSL